MSSEGPTTVGSINATILLNADEFEAKAKEVEAQADRLDGRKVEVKASADTGDAIAKLEALAAAEAQLNDAYERVQVMEQYGTATKANMARAQAALVAADDEYQKALDGEKSAQDAATTTSKAAQTAAEKLAVTKSNLEKASNSYAIAELNLKKVEEDVNATEQSRLRAQNALITAGQQLDKATTAQQAAVAALADAEKAGADADNSAADAKKKATDAGQAQFSIIQALIGASGPLLGATDSLAAATVGLGVGFTAMGAAGVLAILGIKNAMDDATATGQQYSAGLATMQDDLHQLEGTAAVSMLQAFSTAVGDINSAMPSLNTMISEGAMYLGQMGGSVLTAVITGLQLMEPLIRAGAADLSQFVGWLMSGVNTGGFTQFIGYAVANLPSVMTLLENLVTTAGHILAAFAPMGPVVIGVLNGITDVLNALPLPVLAGVVTLFTAAAPAINLTKMAVSGLGPAFGLAGEGATMFGLALDTAIPIVGWIAAGVTGLIALFSTLGGAQQQATVNAQDYASALQADNDAIGANVDAQLAKKAADSGVLDAAQKLGIYTKDIVGYMNGDAEATQRVTDKMNAAKSSIDDMSKAHHDASYRVGEVTDAQKTLQGELDKVNGFLTQNKSAIDAQIGSDKAAAAASQDSAAAAAEEAKNLSDLATQYGVSTSQIQAAQKAYNDTDGATRDQLGTLQALGDKYGDTAISVQGLINAQIAAGGQFDATTLKMQEENDAGGILKATLDGLNGKALSAADAQNAFDSQLANMGTHMNATGKQIQFTTNNIGDMSAASVALRGQLNSQVTDLENVAEAYRNNGHTSDETKAKMEAMRQQIIDNAVAHGVDRDAVTKYIDQILQIPASVPPTKVEIDDAAAKAELASLQAAIDSIHGRTITDTIVTNRVTTGVDPGSLETDLSAQGQQAGNNGGAHAHALGGWSTPSYFADGGFSGLVTASGVANSLARGTDTELAVLTPGEFTVQRASAQALERDHPGALGYMNATGKLPQTGGGMGPITLVAYVQNPFTGEQVQAVVKAVAQQEIGAAARDAAYMRPGIN